MEKKKTIQLSLFTVILLAIIIIIAIALIIILVARKITRKDEVHTKPLTYINTINTENETKSEIPETKKSSKEIEVVASLDDEITSNSAWCGTFQLVWNDIVNNVVKQDVIFTPQKQIVENLNKQTFTEKQLSEEDYYKVYDLLTLELKDTIEKGIKEKFNEKSDILDLIDWSNVPKDNSGYPGYSRKYLFYTMLKKEFNFEKDFDELENGTFGTEYKNIKYFGIDNDSNKDLYSQVDVLYYNSQNDFAIILKTKENEDVILCRGAKGNTYKDMYNNIVKETENYTGNKNYTENDYLKVPNIKLNVLKSFDELCNNKFYSKDNEECKIEKAIQTIQVDLDKSGGKIKSEVAILMGVTVAPVKVEYRYFYLDDEFTMLLKETDKDIPYFAANIEDITLFQE